MAYALIADVQGLNSKRTDYSITTSPTSTEVTGFIDDISSEIDSHLAAQGITTPVTTPASFVNWLSRLNALGAAAQAEMTSFPESDGGQGYTPQGDRYWAMYQQGLKAIDNGTAIPVGSSSTGGAALTARTYGTDNPDESTGEPPAAIFAISPRNRAF